MYRPLRPTNSVQYNSTAVKQREVEEEEGGERISLRFVSHVLVGVRDISEIFVIVVNTTGVTIVIKTIHQSLYSSEYKRVDQNRYLQHQCNTTTLFIELHVHLLTQDWTFYVY